MIDQRKITKAIHTQIGMWRDEQAKEKALQRSLREAVHAYERGFNSGLQFQSQDEFRHKFAEAVYRLAERWEAPLKENVSRFTQALREHSPYGPPHSPRLGAMDHPMEFTTKRVRFEIPAAFYECVIATGPTSRRY